jgi:hypothetical protein
MGWITLSLLGALTLFEAMILCLGQFGFEFVEGGPEPRVLEFAWFVLVCKVIGLGVSRRTGLFMVIVGVSDWIYGIFFQVQDQHQSLHAALSGSVLNIAYALLAIIYTIVAKRWRFEESLKH